MKHIELRFKGFEISQQVGQFPTLILKADVLSNIDDVDYYMDVICELVKSQITIDKDKSGVFLGTK